MSAARSLAPLMLSLLVACGGDEKEVKDPSSADGEPTANDDTPSSSDEGEGEGESEEPEDISKIPTKCAGHSGDICLPGKRFVKKLCDDDYQALTLHLFADGTPWTRGYLTHETNAWNASGGGSSNEKLKLDEEVIILRHRTPDAGGIQVSGASGGYDAIRWDGMCVTLDASEVRFDPPPNPRNARLVWTRIEMDTRDELKKDDTVRDAYIAYKKACKGVTVGRVSKKCETLDGELSVIIADYVRKSGSSLPTPNKMPE